MVSDGMRNPDDKVIFCESVEEHMQDINQELANNMQTIHQSKHLISRASRNGRYPCSYNILSQDPTEEADATQKESPKHKQMTQTHTNKRLLHTSFRDMRSVRYSVETQEMHTEVSASTCGSSDIGTR